MITRHTRSLGDTWTDLVATPAAINPVGPDSPATISGTLGVLEFTSGQNDSCFVWFQLPHAYFEGSNVEPHIHYQRDTSSTGSVKWRMKTIWYNVGSTMPDWSAYSTANDSIGIDDGRARQQLIDAWHVDGAGKTISSLLGLAIQRNSGTGGGDTYAGDAHIVSVDVHYQQRQPGSVQEYRLP